MALTKIETQNIEDGAISTPKLGAEVSASITLIQSVADAANLIPAITSVNVANSTYTVLDDTAVNVGGGYIVITGTGFSTGAQVLIDGTVATSVTRVSSTQLQVQVPAKTAASYNLYVINNTGHTAIKVNGLTYSGTPTWVTGSTLDNQAVDVAFNVAFNATGATSYANTSALPAGTFLLSNGYFYGTVTGIAEETTYSFTVAATDAENQDSPRTFSVTVTVGPNYEIYAWGENFYGQHGTNDRVAHTTPTLLPNVTAKSVGVGSNHLVFIKPEGSLWAVGSSTGLGLNDGITRSSPVQVGSLTDWNEVFAGGNSSAAVKTDGTLWTWGQNNRGQLAQNSTATLLSPTQVGTSTNWQLISMGEYFVGLTTSGTLYAAGLGLPTLTSSPVQLGTNTWTFVAQGFAIRNDGTLWGWGGNNNGELGRNNRTSVNSPVQVGTGTNWSWVSRAQERRTFAIKTDGTLWAMGENSGGELGLSDGVNRSSPTQVGTLTNWSKVSAGGVHAIASKTDGSIWGWGANNVYNLGLGNTTARGSPTLISTGTWSIPFVGQYWSSAVKEV